MPRSRVGRIVVGTLFVIGGLLGFLPILGFWMVPLGLLILSQDLRFVRRKRRQLAIWWEYRKRARQTRGEGTTASAPESKSISGEHDA